MPDYLRIHAATNGTVWYGDAKVMAADSGLVPSAFFATSLFRSSRLVRLLGSARNAHLVAAIHEFRSRGDIGPAFRVQLGSPTLCSQECKPQEALAKVWYSCSLRDGFGSWYTMADSDYTPYALTATVRANKGEVNDKARRLLLYHPAWPALAFVPGHDVDACCRLLSRIVDPRWFTHHERPGRLTKLYSYLGLTPENAATMLSSMSGLKPVGNRYYDRAVDTVSAWLGHSPDLISQCPMPILSSRDFLRRSFFTADSRVRGLLTATQRFVRLLKEVWVGERAHTSGSHFDPELFFKDEEEVSEYNAHRRSFATAFRIAMARAIDSPEAPQ